MSPVEMTQWHYDVLQTVPSLFKREYFNLTEDPTTFSKPGIHHDLLLGPLIAASVMLTSAWVAVFLRFYTRTRIVHNLGWDDICMFIAIIFFTVFAGADIRISTSETDFMFMTIPQLLGIIDCVLLVLIFYCATMTMLKLSLGIFLLRIIIKPWQKRIVYATMAVTTAWGITTTLFAIFQCGYPKSATLFMERRMFGVGCVSQHATNGMTFTHGGISTASDIVYTILPVFILRDAKMNRRARILLTVLLCLGSLGSIASLVRFAYLNHLPVISPDYFRQTAKLAVWSLVECGLGITAGSFATLRPLVRKFVDEARHLTTRTSNWSRRFSVSARGPNSTQGSYRKWRHSRTLSGGSDMVPMPEAPQHGQRKWSWDSKREKDPELAWGSNPPYSYDWARAGGPGSACSPDGSRLGNETVISVGTDAMSGGRHGSSGGSSSHNHQRRHSSRSNLKKQTRTKVVEITEEQATTPPLPGSGHSNAWRDGGIERETVFETSSSRYAHSDDGGSSSGNSRSDREKNDAKSLPKAYML